MLEIREKKAFEDAANIRDGQSYPLHSGDGGAERRRVKSNEGPPD